MWFAAVILSLSLATAWSAEICCGSDGCFNDNAPFSHFPLPDCPADQGTVFNLFTRSNRNSAQSMTRTSIPSVFSGSRMTIFIVHGWTGAPTNDWMHNIKDALLDREDVNVVITGWQSGAGEAYYPQSASNTRAAGVDLGFVMDNIKNNGGSAASRIYCIGHSLGSHMCGHAGRASSIGRITGLDPAGPWFDQGAETCGLYTDSASFVDVLHTHGKDGPLQYGTLRVLGHMDFYPNEGGFQPGCTGRSLKAGRPHFYGWATDGNEVVEPQGDEGCSHGMAHSFFTESVKNDCFTAISQCTNNENIPGSCSSCGSNCPVMGYGARGSGGNGLYYLTTSASAPYCQG